MPVTFRGSVSYLDRIGMIFKIVRLVEYCTFFAIYIYNVSKEVTTAHFKNTISI